MAAIFPEDPCPIVIVDVDYRQSEAVAAAIVANTWDTPNTIETRLTRIAEVKPYQPGAFFERELPCILQVLALIKSEFRVVVIDGYVELDEHGRPGLGAHLHAYLQKNVVVVGVAKTAFHGSPFAVPVLRGTSDKPLYVTARGIDKEHAAKLVRRMHGTYRLPTLIKEVDTLARR
jgi:deoxyribonuclease V